MEGHKDAKESWLCLNYHSATFGLQVAWNAMLAQMHAAGVAAEESEATILLSEMLASIAT